MFRLVPKRHCGKRSCPDAGRLWHRAHSPCRMLTCVDRGVDHWGDHRVLVQPTRQPVKKGQCEWSVPDPQGYGNDMPHGVKARWRVTDAGEFLDGNYCIRHADQAVDYAVRGVEVGP